MIVKLLLGFFFLFSFFACFFFSSCSCSFFSLFSLSSFLGGGGGLSFIFLFAFCRFKDKNFFLLQRSECLYDFNNSVLFTNEVVM